MNNDEYPFVYALVAFNLTRILKNKKMSLGELSRLTRVDKASLSRICSGVSKNITVKTLDRLASKLEVPALELFLPMWVEGENVITIRAEKSDVGLTMGMSK